MLSTPITEDPMAVFLYAVKSPESKRQYPRRFKMFLDFLGFGGVLEEQAKEFLRSAKGNPGISYKHEPVIVINLSAVITFIRMMDYRSKIMIFLI